MSRLGFTPSGSEPEVVAILFRGLEMLGNNQGIRAIPAHKIQQATVLVLAVSTLDNPRFSDGTEDFCAFYTHCLTSCISGAMLAGPSGVSGQLAVEEADHDVQRLAGLRQLQCVPVRMRQSVEDNEFRLPSRT